MIVRSFFRKATTKIYVVLLVTIITVVGILNSSNINLRKRIDNVYYNTNLFIVFSDENISEYLRSDKRVNKVRRALEFKSAESDEMVMDDYNKNNPLSWTLLSYYGTNSMLAYKDDDNKLKDNDILLGLDSLTYSNLVNILDKYNGKLIHVLYKEKEYTFVIKGLYDAGMFAEFKIANSTFEEMLQEETSSIITSKIKKEKYHKQIFNDYKYLEKDDKAKIGIASFFDSREGSNYQSLEQYKSEVKKLNKAIYVLYIVFLIMFIIISKNVLEDLSINIKLERMLGYNNKNIKINILKRLFRLYSTNLIISMIASIVIAIIFNKANFGDLMIFNYSYFIKIILFLLIANFVLVLFLNNKLKRY